MSPAPAQARRRGSSLLTTSQARARDPLDQSNLPHMLELLRQFHRPHPARCAKETAATATSRNQKSNKQFRRRPRQSAKLVGVQLDRKNVPTLVHSTAERR